MSDAVSTNSSSPKMNQKATGPGSRRLTGAGQAAAGFPGRRAVLTSTGPMSAAVILAQRWPCRKPATSPVSHSTIPAPSRIAMPMSSAWSSGPSRFTTGFIALTRPARPPRALAGRSSPSAAPTR